MRPARLLGRAKHPIFRLQTRSTTMGLINNLKTALRGLSRDELELDYLNQSVSRVDLEMRQREVDRGRFRSIPRRSIL